MGLAEWQLVHLDLTAPESQEEPGMKADHIVQKGLFPTQCPMSTRGKLTLLPPSDTQENVPSSNQLEIQVWPVLMRMASILKQMFKVKVYLSLSMT